MGTYRKLDKKGGKASAGKAAEKPEKKPAAAPKPAAAGKEPTEVVKAPETAIMAAPDWLDEPEDGDIGMEVDMDDVSTPLIKLVQPGSREAARGDIQAGHYLNLKTGEDLGDTVVFVPLRRHMKRILWTPVDDGGGIICRSFDGKQGNVYGDCATCRNEETGIRRQDFGKDDPPECTRYADYPAIILGDVAVGEDNVVALEGKLAEEPVGVLSFARSSYSASKDLAQAVLKNRLKIFANVFAVSSKFIEGQSNSYYVSEVEWVGWTPKAIYQRIKDHWADLMMIIGSPELYTPETDHMAEETFGGEDTQTEQPAAAGVEADLVEPDEAGAPAAGPDDDLPF